MNIIIIGGAGFIGSNLAYFFLTHNHHVIIFDNLSRPGSSHNLSWLQTLHNKKNFSFVKGDICSYEDIKKLFTRHRDTDVIIHAAAQVAVTTSITDPRRDFENNLLGTFNVLEALREIYIPSATKQSTQSHHGPLLIFSSTNKVYGDLHTCGMQEGPLRYTLTNPEKGISEQQPLDFYSPYGCSKGAADQYVLDYSRIYGLRTTVFRKSCIYGARQFGMEEQGWVAWFIIAAILSKNITIYGNGKQVRDILFINDLVSAYDKAIQHPEAVIGKVYNIGGGIHNSCSLLELIGLLKEFLGKDIPVTKKPARHGDQRIFIADTSRAYTDFGWQPKTEVRDGVCTLVEWVSDNHDLFRI